MVLLAAKKLERMNGLDQLKATMNRVLNTVVQRNERMLDYLIDLKKQEDDNYIHNQLFIDLCYPMSKEEGIQCIKDEVGSARERK